MPGLRAFGNFAMLAWFGGALATGVLAAHWGARFVLVLALTAALVMATLVLQPRLARRQVLSDSRLPFAIAAIAVFLVSHNALRPVASATVADAFWLLAAVLTVPLVWGRRPLPKAPGYLLASGALLALAAFAVELFPPQSPSFAALFFPGELFSPVGVGERSAGFSNLGALLRTEIALLAVPYLLVILCNSRARVQLMMESFVWGVALGGSIVVLDWMSITHIGGIEGAQAAGGSIRPMGLATHSNVFALCAALAMPLAVVAAAEATSWRRWASLFAAAVLIVSLLASGSRGGLMAAIGGLVLVSIMNPGARRVVKRAALPIIVVGTGVAILVGLPPTVERVLGAESSVESSNQGRAAILERVWGEIQERPLVGYGFQYIRGSHNVYVQMLHAGGVLALLGWLVFVIGLIRAGWNVVRRPRIGHGLLAAGLVASVTSWLLIGGLLAPAVFDRFLYVPVGLLIACAGLNQEPAAEGTNSTAQR